jgi:hypothetical protein
VSGFFEQGHHVVAVEQVVTQNQAGRTSRKKCF